jgi:Protein of unknown function (DUF1622)
VRLELLVAADIIRTVAIDPTFQSVGALGLAKRGWRGSHCGGRRRTLSDHGLEGGRI